MGVYTQRITQGEGLVCCLLLNLWRAWGGHAGPSRASPTGPGGRPMPWSPWPGARPLRPFMHSGPWPLTSRDDSCSCCSSSFTQHLSSSTRTSTCARSSSSRAASLALPPVDSSCCRHRWASTQLSCARDLAGSHGPCHPCHNARTKAVGAAMTLSPAPHTALTWYTLPVSLLLAWQLCPRPLETLLPGSQGPCLMVGALPAMGQSLTSWWVLSVLLHSSLRFSSSDFSRFSIICRCTRGSPCSSKERPRPRTAKPAEPLEGRLPVSVPSPEKSRCASPTSAAPSVRLYSAHRFRMVSRRWRSCRVRGYQSAGCSQSGGPRRASNTTHPCRCRHRCPGPPALPSAQGHHSPRRSNATMG